MDVSTYLDRARVVAGAQSDYALAGALGITKQTVSDMRKGRMLPGDELMTRIADLAGEDQALALLRLNYWRARHGAAKATYKRMIERLGYAAGVAAFGLTVFGAPSPSRHAPAASFA